jgi:hypothetical protein
MFALNWFSPACIGAGIEWHPDENWSEYSLGESVLYLVNRETAIAQLMRIHEQNFEQAEAMGVALKPCIPLCSNLHGLGKSFLAMNYIQKCREQWKDIAVQSKFQATLRSCRTLHIHMLTAKPWNRVDFDGEMIRLLKKSLNNRFKTPPSCLQNDYPSSQEFLKALTSEAGPVFIVLDGIGNLFRPHYPERSDLHCHHDFILFCTQVVSTWTSIKEVFFLLSGRSTFLSLVGSARPHPEKNTRSTCISSQLEFRHLSLEMIPEHAIAEILKNTWFDCPGGIRLAEHYGLDANQLKMVSRLIYSQTNGHPRSMLRFLHGCNSFQDFLELEPQKIIHDNDWPCFKQEVALNKRAIRYLVQRCRKKRVVDLGEIWDHRCTNARGSKATRVPLDLIASHVGFAWGGSATEATLHMHPSILEILDNFVAPLEDFLKRIHASKRVSLNYPNAFEWVFIWRLQELFSNTDKESPRAVLPAFFDTPLFGRCNGLVFDEFVQLLPKVTSTVKKQQPRTFLFDNTMSPRDLACFFFPGKIDVQETIALKALPNSASPDALFAMNAHLPSGGPVRLTMGVALKCCKQGTDSGFGREQLDDECVKFNQMFTDHPRSASRRLNVLLICATHYKSELNDQFNGQRFRVMDADKNFKHIDELILLDLASLEKRAAFFGLRPDHILASAIEKVVDS